MWWESWDVPPGYLSWDQGRMRRHLCSTDGMNTRGWWWGCPGGNWPGSSRGPEKLPEWRLTSTWRDLMEDDLTRTENPGGLSWWRLAQLNRGPWGDPLGIGLGFSRGLKGYLDRNQLGSSNIPTRCLIFPYSLILLGIWHERLLWWFMNKELPCYPRWLFVTYFTL